MQTPPPDRGGLLKPKAARASSIAFLRPIREERPSTSMYLDAVIGFVELRNFVKESSLKVEGGSFLDLQMRIRVS